MDAIELEKPAIMEQTQGRYQIEAFLGQGAYGSTFKVIANDDQSAYTLKHLFNIFEDQSRNINAKRILREIRILKHLAHHENIICLHEVSTKYDYNHFSGLCIIYNFMESTLTNVINTNTLTRTHHQYFLYQILRGLKYIHSANIIHRDLKPDNILVNSNCDLRISDFGHSRVIGQRFETDAALSQYVTTRYYRAPEICLNYDDYGPAIDIWSTGCILAQLLSQQILFKGKSTFEQLKLMVTILGSPSEDDLQGCTNPNARKYMYSLCQREPIPFHALFPKADENELDLLSRMLCWNPNNRITVDEALQHPYFAEYHHPNYEVTTMPLDTSDFDREDIALNELKYFIWKEIFGEE